MSHYMTFRGLEEFHGHACPNLALAYRMATSALAHLGCPRCVEDELLAIVERRDCGIDAVQFVTGCTIGKENLIIRDDQERRLILLEIRTGRGVTIVPSPWTIERQAKWANEKSLWDDTIKAILKYPKSQLLRITELVLSPEDVNIMIADVSGDREEEGRAWVERTKI